MKDIAHIVHMYNLVMLRCDHARVNPRWIKGEIDCWLLIGTDPV